MRMTRRLLLTGLLAMLATLPPAAVADAATTVPYGVRVGTAASGALIDGGVRIGAHLALAGGVAVVAQATTAPPGPAIQAPGSEGAARSAEVRQKAWAGGIAIVLLAIVFYGRKLRKKRRQQT